MLSKKISPLEKKELKEAARRQGVDIHSLYSYEYAQTRNPASIKEFVCISKLNKEQVVGVLIPYFKALGYIGAISVTKRPESAWSINLSNRVRDV
ncbi:hypothetical protein [Deinococcus sp. Leaf326]|uniref:hypothetical protein n=1 Tax=Deinococcus sp. Leaf326 TaxID=1736338 RepID=UPI0012E129EF|nr:hypothetical protein [Deinococcus sp. Leaf326]